MPIIPSLREGRLTGRPKPTAAFLQDFLSAWGFRAVTLAFRTGVLTALRDRPATAAELSNALSLDPKGTALLLDALDCLLYVRPDRDRYHLTPAAARLVPMVGDGIPYFERLVYVDWADLEDRLRARKQLPFEVDAPATTHWFAKDRQVFQNGMIALANLSLDEVLRRVPIPRRDGHVLDVGGGHGMYCAALCARHPGLTATVLDVPEMSRITEQTIARFDAAGRVTFRGGDFLTDDLGACTIALLFNVINSRSETQARALLGRCSAAIEPGGAVVLLDKFPARRLGGIGRAFGALMSVNMFSAVGQQTYRLGQVRSWMRDAGFVSVRIHPVRSAPGCALIIGRRQGHRR